MDRQSVYEMQTDRGALVLAGLFGSCFAGGCVLLLDAAATSEKLLAGGVGATVGSSLGGILALWFGAELGRWWCWLFGLVLGWYVALACMMVGDLLAWPAFGVGGTAGSLLGWWLARTLAGFSRPARGTSYKGAWAAAAIVFLAGLLLIRDGMALVGLPLVGLLGAIVGALVGAERN